MSTALALALALTLGLTVGVETIGAPDEGEAPVSYPPPGANVGAGGGATAELDGEGGEPDPVPYPGVGAVPLGGAPSNAMIFLTACSAATMTITCVLPDGKSACIPASTTNRLSVP